MKSALEMKLDSRNEAIIQRLLIAGITVLVLVILLLGGGLSWQMSLIICVPTILFFLLSAGKAWINNEF